MASTRRLCDVNVLLALVYGCHEFHAHAVAWLDAIQDAHSVVVCRQTQMGLMRLLSTRVVMAEDIHSLSTCWDVFDAMMADDRFLFQREPRELEPALRRMMRSATPAPKLWQDAYLAAFAASSGMQLVTFDRGFRQYADLDVLVLGAASRG
jgi:toxin-antitoxin system PIN domain toxin